MYVRRLETLAPPNPAAIDEKGSCFCGGVKFSVAGVKVFEGFCHCPSCKRAGAPPQIVGVMGSDGPPVTVVAGVGLLKTKTSFGKSHSSCSRCGAHIFQVPSGSKDSYQATYPTSFTTTPTSPNDIRTPAEAALALKVTSPSPLRPSTSAACLCGQCGDGERCPSCEARSRKWQEAASLKSRRESASRPSDRSPRSLMQTITAQRVEHELEQALTKSAWRRFERMFREKVLPVLVPIASVVTIPVIAYAFGLLELDEGAGADAANVSSLSIAQ